MFYSIDLDAKNQALQFTVACTPDTALFFFFFSFYIYRVNITVYVDIRSLKKKSAWLFYV